jgi:hypothetical protein
VVAVCAAIEAEIADLDDADKAEFLADLGMEEPGLDRLIRAGFKLLGLQTYFTAGVKEVRAWTIHVGDTAPQAAGVIHTDFERGFIRAQTIALRRLHRVQGRAWRQGSRQDARRRQGIRGAGWRRDELPVQRLSHSGRFPRSRTIKTPTTLEVVGVFVSASSAEGYRRYEPTLSWPPRPRPPFTSCAL